MNLSLFLTGLLVTSANANPFQDELNSDEVTLENEEGPCADWAQRYQEYGNTVRAVHVRLDQATELNWLLPSGQYSPRLWVHAATASSSRDLVQESRQLGSDKRPCKPYIMEDTSTQEMYYGGIEELMFMSYLRLLTYSQSSRQLQGFLDREGLDHEIINALRGGMIHWTDRGHYWEFKELILEHAIDTQTIERLGDVAASLPMEGRLELVAHHWLSELWTATSPITIAGARRQVHADKYWASNNRLQSTMLRREMQKAGITMRYRVEIARAAHVWGLRHASVWINQVRKEVQSSNLPDKHKLLGRLPSDE